MDGLALLDRLVSDPRTSHIPVALVSGCTDLPFRERAFAAGAVDVLGKPLDVLEIRSKVKTLLRLLPSRAADGPSLAFGSGADAGLDALLRCLERIAIARDEDTGQHTARMAHYAAAIAKAHGLPAQFQREILEAAPLHDLGKIGIPDDILLKPGKLTPDEFEIMKQHAQIGHSILQGYPFAVLQTAAEIALHHHESFDGSGYPSGVGGEGIPIAARIVALADVFDALSTQRPYKQPWSVEDSVAFIRQQAGRKFDPAVVVAFEACLDDLLVIRSRFCQEHDDAQAQAPSL
jgi:putative two-component system response regulator